MRRRQKYIHCRFAGIASFIVVCSLCVYAVCMDRRPDWYRTLLHIRLHMPASDGDLLLLFIMTSISHFSSDNNLLRSQNLSRQLDDGKLLWPSVVGKLFHIQSLPIDGSSINQTIIMNLSHCTANSFYNELGVHNWLCTARPFGCSSKYTWHDSVRNENCENGTELEELIAD